MLEDHFPMFGLESQLSLRSLYHDPLFVIKAPPENKESENETYVHQFDYVYYNDGIASVPPRCSTLAA